MRRTGGLWEKISSKEALYAAYLTARKGKRRRSACHKFERNLGANIEGLHAALADGSYQPHEPNRFFVYEPKKRLIEAPAFKDLVVQHALYAQVMGVFDRKFSHSSFACRRGKGTHKAADAVQDYLRRSPRDSWVLKIDCRKFFYSINHDALKAQFRDFIKCPKTLDLMDKFVHRQEGVGVPIGNLMSQVFGLLYLNGLDHFIKRDLQIRFYARYVDDMVMVCRSSNHAKEVLERVRLYMQDNLNLEISKFSISRICQGINCFGFRTWSSIRFIRKRSLYLASNRIKQGDLTEFISCLGHAKRTASKNHLLNIARTHNAYLSIPESLR